MQAVIITITEVLEYSDNVYSLWRQASLIQMVTLTRYLTFSKFLNIWAPGFPHP